jgi:hypothetical protein
MNEDRLAAPACRCEDSDRAPGERLLPPRPRTVRRFVNRGGQLVEVEAVVRETR